MTWAAAGAKFFQKGVDILPGKWYYIVTEGKELRVTKSRKVLKITFPTSMGCTLFAWDGNVSGYKHHDESLTVMLVEVQQRRARSEMARTARIIYGATTETLVR